MYIWGFLSGQHMLDMVGAGKPDLLNRGISRR
jgi:hypothetical protein